MKTTRTYALVLSALFTAGISTILLLIWSTRLTARPIMDIITSLFPHSSMNLFTITKINKTSFLAFFYITMFIALIFHTLIIKFFDKTHDLSIKKNILYLVLSFFASFTALQTVNNIFHLNDEFKTYNGKNIYEKKTAIFGLPFVFSTYCQKYMPGKHKAVFIYDLDPSMGEGLMLKERLFYMLFPIDIANITNADPDCAIIFCKKEPVLPDDIRKRFPVINVFGRYLAIATEKEIN